MMNRITAGRGRPGLGVEPADLELSRDQTDPRARGRWLAVESPPMPLA